MEGLLVVERMVIESIGKRKKELKDIVEDTGLGQNFVKGLLSQLVEKNILCQSRGVYFLSESFDQEWLPVLNKKENIKEEFCEMFQSIIEQRFAEERELSSKNDTQTSEVRLQKILLTSCEDRMLQAQLKSIDMFIAGIKQQRKRKPLHGPLKSQKVVFWGHTDYQNMVRGSLKV